MSQQPATRVSPGRAGEALLALTYRQVADTLQVSERTVWTLVKTGQLAAVRIGRAVRIPVDEVRAYLARQTARQTALRLRDRADEAEDTPGTGVACD
jgi:excisionase family DNA binding protein